MEKEYRELKKTSSLTSDDFHVIALAKVGKVKLLLSKDQNLGKDFKTICNGKIYKTKHHKGLLQKIYAPRDFKTFCA